MSYQGDYLAASTIVFNFNTVAFSDGSPITLAGTPALSVYKNSTTESTAGITLTVDYDSRTGMHHVVIDTSADGTFYAAGNDFDVIITAGTVGGTSVVGRKVGSFSLQNRTQYADVRKALGNAVTTTTNGILDVNTKNINNVAAATNANNFLKVSLNDILATTLTETSGQLAGGFKQFFNVASPTSTMNLITAVTTTTTATNVTTVNGLTANVITAASIADGAIDRATFAADTGLQTIRSGTAQATGNDTTHIKLDSGASATDNFYNNDLIYYTGGTGVGQSKFITAYDGTTKIATLNSAVATAADNTTTFAIIAFDSIPGATAPTAAQNATAVWTDLLASSDFSTVSSIGKLIKDNLDAAVSSRMATFSLPTNFSALGISAGGHISNVDTLTTYTGNTPQTGDSFARIGSTGSGLTSLAPASTALSTAQWTNARAANLDNADAAVSSRLATTSITLAAGAVTVGTNNDKTGYALSSSGLDSISTTAPAGVASNFREMIVQLWRRFFKKADLNKNTGALKTYADNGTSVLTTQTCTDDGTTQTEGAAT